MHAGAVVAFRVVLADDLPVGVDVVLDAPRSPQVTQREPLETPAQVREAIRQLGRVGIEAREHEALPDGRLAGTSPVTRSEVHQRVRMACPSQPPVELAGPRVRALEPDDAALRFRADERAVDGGTRCGTRG